MDLSRFIPSYPDDKVADYHTIMGSKYEFQELLDSPCESYIRDKYFYNYQELLGRWISPATNSRMILIRWDPGVGKTRGAFNIALSFLRNSNYRNAMFLSGAAIINKSMRETVTKYYNYEFKGPKEDTPTGDDKKRKKHGKSTSMTRKTKQLGITPDTVVSFVNSLIGLKEPTTKKAKDEASTRSLPKEGTSTRGGTKEWQEYLSKPEWKLELRKKYRNHIFIIDEVHLFRSVGAKDSKRNYSYLMALLDAVRDICPIILMTATPIVDTWVDMFSIISMLYPHHMRTTMFREVNDVFGVKSDDLVTVGSGKEYKSPSATNRDKLASIVTKYMKGLVSDRISADVVPNSLPLPQVMDGHDITDNKYVVKYNDFVDSTWDTYYDIAMDYMRNHGLPTIDTQWFNSKDNLGKPDYRPVGKWLIYSKIEYCKLSNNKRKQLDLIPGFINITPSTKDITTYGMDNTRIGEHLYISFMSKEQSDRISRAVQGTTNFNVQEVTEFCIDRNTTDEDADKRVDDDHKREAAYNTVRQLHEFAYPMMRFRRAQTYSIPEPTLVSKELATYVSDIIGVSVPSTKDGEYIFTGSDVLLRVFGRDSSVYMTTNKLDSPPNNYIYLTQRMMDLLSDDITGDAELYNGSMIVSLSTISEYVADMIGDKISVVKSIKTELSALCKKLGELYPLYNILNDYPLPGDMVHLESDGLTYAASDNSTRRLDDDRIENIFEITWDGKVPSRERGLGKYSAKYADIIAMLKYDPLLQNKAGYIHTLWVKTGTLNFAAALIKNGWEQYTGRDSISAKGDKPRFAIIHGETGSDTTIQNIIDVYNLPSNRDGSILRLIIGSRKSGISISFDNAQFFFALSPDFNKTTHIQARARAFRASSLTYMPKSKRNIYVADFISIPTPNSKELINDLSKGIIANMYYAPDDPEIPNDGVIPFTTEIAMYVAAEQKYAAGSRLSDALKESSIETIITTEMKKGNTDIHTHALLYGMEKIESRKVDILNNINNAWYSPIPTIGGIPDMYTMKAGADLVSSRVYTTTKYGMLRPVQSIGNSFTAYDGKADTLSLAYDHNFFTLDQGKGYSARELTDVINEISKMPTSEYAFRRSLSISKINKVICLELSLTSMNVHGKLYSISDPYRKLIVDMYSDLWTVFTSKDNKGNRTGGDIAHILYYAIKPNAHLSKTGIKADRKLRTRIARYSSKQGMDKGHLWQYIDTVDREAIYMTALTTRVYDKEDEVICKALKLDLDYYVHFALCSGNIIYREIIDEDRKMSTQRTESVIATDSSVSKSLTCKILGISGNEYDRRAKAADLTLNEAVYNKAKQLGIIIIR